MTCPATFIRRAHQASTALVAEECARFDLTSVQFAALLAIKANPDVDAMRLSALIAFGCPTIGGVLERLEAKGWMPRSSSPAVKRVKLLRLTLEGERLLRQVKPAVRRVQQRLLEPLAPAGRAAMLRLLAQFAAVHNDVTAAPLQAADRG